jgi:hypothetical protein
MQGFQGESVWWSWTAPFPGPVTITTAGSDFETILGVYLGITLSTLRLVAIYIAVMWTGNKVVNWDRLNSLMCNVQFFGSEPGIQIR